jgi:ubiquinone/menaquinone biosynthesis C-methylase UbiE
MNCDRIARSYRAFEYLAFGRALERRRFGYIKDVSEAKRVLILGDGDGRFTAEFLKWNKGARVESIDSSGRMLALARARLDDAAAERVQFRVGDARTVDLAGTYDLVVTHFFLDCFTDAEAARLIERMAGFCEPGARWLISEFRLPRASVRRLAAKALIRFMYFCFRLTTGLKVTRLPDYEPLLEKSGFALQKRQKALGGMLVSEIWRT